MAETTFQPESIPIEKPERSSSGFMRVARYTVVRIITLFLTTVVGVYLTVLIANMGGYVDQIQRAMIREDVNQLLRNDVSFRALPQEEKDARANEMIRLREERIGLDQPFAVRSVRFLTNALTLNLGWAQNMASDSGSRQVRNIMLERLPPTLFLFASSNILLFFFSIFIALSLSRRYGTFWDRVIVGMAPTGSAPGWFYGIFLIVIFAAVLRVLPYGGMVSAPPPENPFDYFLSLLEHLTLPVLAITISTIFLNAYNWRTFFLIYSSEDYVEMAKAKGLSSRMLERRYILRPTLPTIISTFALTLITLWTGAPILEGVFNWPGLGQTLLKAIGQYETPVIVGSTVIFAYMLALTVFLLDFIYALVDPRVKVGGGKKHV
ncbi:MAG TPA: ABC transporter permease [Anaerolineales bacterium]|nr:ABC transporter permease [Anaerolineales bacterium]